MSGESEQSEAVEVFCAYAHKDEAMREELEKHLSILQRQGLISIWHDRKIEPGEEWQTEIDTNINKAEIILLLVSPDFINSDYCWDVEVKQAIERHETNQARVIPIILRPCLWKRSPLGKLQALPKDGKPVTDWNHPDQAFFNIAEGIQTTIEDLETTKTKSEVLKSLLEEEEEEEGYLDLAEIVEENLNNSRDVIVRMTSILHTLVEEMNQRTSEMNQLASRQRGTASKQATKDIISQAAQDMEGFAIAMDKEIVDFAEAYSIGIEAIGRASELVVDFNRQEQADFLSVASKIQEMIDVYGETRDQLREFRQVIAVLPRVTSVFNKAKRKTLNVLDLLDDELVTAIDRSRVTKKLVEEIELDDEDSYQLKEDLQMYEKFSKIIQDVHRATGIPEDGSGQCFIRDPLRFGQIGVEGQDWIKKGSHLRAPFGLTEEFFDRYVEWLKNRHNL